MNQRRKNLWISAFMMIEPHTAASFDLSPLYMPFFFLAMPHIVNFYDFQ